MILPKKTLLLLGLVFSSLVGVIYAVSSTVLWHNIRQAEQENTRQSVKGVLRLLSQTQDEFSSRFADWSAWDATYKFIKDTNEDYITSNLNFQTLANLNVDLAIFIQPSGRVVYSTSIDRQHLRTTSIPEALRVHLNPQDRLLQHGSKSSLTGILLLPEGPMLITSRPIVNSQGKGPIRGTVIFGKYLDADEIKQLSEGTSASLSLHELNEAQMPPDFQAASHSLSAKEPILTRPLNEQIIAGYVLLPDIYGKPALLLRVDVSRDIYQQGKNSWLYLLISLLIVELVFGVIIMLLLQRLVLFLKQRQQARFALQQAEAKYRSIFENAIEGIFQTTPDGRFISANPAIARIYGYESPESLITSLHNIEQQLYVDPNRRVEFIHLMQQHDAVSGFEAQVYRQDGSIIWISENARAVKDENGVLLNYEGFVEDITERKQAQEKLESKVAERTTELRKANEHLQSEIVERKLAEAALCSSVATNRALLNAIPDSIFRISSDGTFVNFKAAKKEPLPLPPGDFLSKNLYQVLPPEVAQSMMNYLKLALSTDEVQICEYQLLLNNQVQDYEARIIVSAENEVMAIIRNITERKHAEHKIRKSLTKEKELSELKSRFITMTSHEFRTPLTTILSSTELLHDYGNKWTEEKKFQHFQRIVSTVKHMTKLLEEVLLIGKAEAGKLTFNPTTLDLNQFCRKLVDEIQITTNNHTICFKSQISCVQADMDEKLLRHILSNLLSNAIKYSPQVGTVYFELFCEKGEAIFRIQDQGIGIPVADQAKLFDSFHRASNVGTIYGTGLGLSIVKKSVELHNGRIVVNSKEGIGTTFTVRIPLHNQTLLG